MIKLWRGIAIGDEGRDYLSGVTAFRDSGAQLLPMLLQGGELLHIFGLMGEDFLGILRLNELLGVIERRLQIRFGEAERLSADTLGGRLQGACGAFRLRGCLVSGLNKTFKGLADTPRRSSRSSHGFRRGFHRGSWSRPAPFPKIEAHMRIEFASEPSHCWRCLYRLAVGGRQRCNNVARSSPHLRTFGVAASSLYFPPASPALIGIWGVFISRSHSARSPFTASNAGAAPANWEHLALIVIRRNFISALPRKCAAF